MGGTTFAWVTLAWLSAGTAWAGNNEAPVEARFRGCEPTGWCRFSFEGPGDREATVQRVLPDGITPRLRDDALRDRLNALLSDMIHQHKRIELRNLRARQGGGSSATVTVTGVPLTDDATLRELLAREPAAIDPDQAR